MKELNYSWRNKETAEAVSVFSLDGMVPIERTEMFCNLLSGSAMGLGSSLELLLEADFRQPGGVSEQLILRRYEPGAVCSGMRSLEQKVAKQFESRLQSRRNLLLCIPEESLPNITRCYVPSGYTFTGIPDIEKLRRILKNNSNCGVSLLFHKISYVENEINMICANLDWISQSFPADRETKEAIQTYEAFLSIKDEKKCILCISIWGENASMDALVFAFREEGYELMEFPPEISASCRYLEEGADLLVDCAICYGHNQRDGITIPSGLERLNYIIPVSFVVSRMRKTSGSVNRIPAYSEVRKETAKEFLNEGVIRMTDGYGSAYKNTGIYLGKETETNKEVFLSADQMASHLVIAGMSGSGKTSLMFQILMQLEKEKIPFLVIEPTKTEYRGLLEVMPDLKVLTPGKTEVSPVMFNPFLPPKGITLEQFIPGLVAAFQMAFSLTTPLDVILMEVIRNVYVKYNWRNNSTRDSSDVRIFGMNEFICAFKEEIQKSSYDPESKQNLNSGGVYRFQSMVNSNPYLFDTDQSLDLDSFLHGNTLIELEGIDHPEHKSLFLALLLLQLKLVIRKNQKKDSKLKNVIMIDEAHVLLDQAQNRTERNEANPGGKLQEALLNMVRENRVYGTGMIFADQSLAVLQEFVNNSNVKMVMHLESAAEREFLSANLNLSYDVYMKIAGLQKGEFYLSYGSAREPIMVKGVDSRGENSINSDVEDALIRSRMGDFHERPFYACPCKRGCDLAVKTEAEFIARKLCNEISGLFSDRSALEQYIRMNLDDAICQIAEESDLDNEKRLIRCARLMTERMIRTKTFF